MNQLLLKREYDPNTLMLRIKNTRSHRYMKSHLMVMITEKNKNHPSVKIISVFSFLQILMQGYRREAGISQKFV